MPGNVNAGIAVFDRQTGSFLTQLHTTTRFRSASLVKLLIALDYLWNRGPAYALADTDRARFQVMLRSSDDDAATYFWNKGGTEQVVIRMVSRLSLQGTRPPSAIGRTGWGSTTLTAADLVRIYSYLLDTAPAGMRDTVLGNLRQATRCGTDRFEQSFGIPSAMARPWAIKQGWYGFGDIPADPCTATEALPLTAPPSPPAIKGSAASGVLSGEVLHTTGIVGTGDRYIVAMLTQYPPGTCFATAAATISYLAWSLPVPGALPPAAT